MTLANEHAQQTGAGGGILRTITRGLGRFIARFWGVLLILLAWQLWVSFNDYNSIVMPQPASVLEAVFRHWKLYVAAGAQTLVVALVGTALGMGCGALSAVLSWWSRVIGGLITPLALIFSAVPAVALVPVIARLLGYDIRTVIVIVIVISFFPAYVFTAQGLRSLPAGSADLFRVYGARRSTLLFRLALPAAVPSFMTAFRLGAASSVLSAIVAEFAMGSNGLGEVFRSARVEFDMARALGASLVAMVISVIFFMIAIQLERLVRARWE